MKLLADEDGLTLKFAEKLPNSRLALYISEFARKKGKFEEFHKLVLEAYWLEGKDIGDKSLLLDLAESVGLNKNEIEIYLDTDEPFKVLQNTLKELRTYGINGVPTFFIEEELIIGAQPYEIYKVLDEKSK